MKNHSTCEETKKEIMGKFALGIIRVARYQWPSNMEGLSPATRSFARPVDTTSENAPTSVLGKLGTVTVLMRSVSNGVTAVAAKNAEIALHRGDRG